jgi:hypothetical protein
MKTINKVALTVLFATAAVVDTGLVNSFSNASKILAGAGFTSINVKPTGLASKKDYLFANNFDAKDNNGRTITGTYSQSFYGKNMHFKIKDAS